MLLDKPDGNNPLVIEFFDSFAQPMESYDLKLHPFIKECKIVENTKIVQAPTSSVCGAHCLYILYNKLKGRNMSDIIRKNFSACNLKYNDWVSSMFFNTLCFTREARTSATRNCQTCRPLIVSKYKE